MKRYKDVVHELIMLFNPSIRRTLEVDILEIEIKKREMDYV